MTSFTQAADAAEALIEQLQGLAESSRFIPRYFDTLFGLRTAFGDAGQRFAAAYSGEGGELPIFSTVRDRCEQASSIGASMTPTDASMSHYSSAVQRAITALKGEPTIAPRGKLRGALRLRVATPPALRRDKAQTPASEPYYGSLVKLFPVEAVTLYPLAISIADNDVVIRLILIAIITLFVAELRWFGTQEESGGHADLLAIAVSVISFELYAASLGGFGHLPGGPEQTRQLFAFITIMWVALVPFALRRARR
jgi:hypothetical protein